QLLVAGDGEGAHGERALHEVEVLVGGAVLEGEGGVVLSDLQDGEVAPGSDRHVVVGRGEVALRHRVGARGGAGGEIALDGEEDGRPDPAAHLGAGAPDQEAGVRRGAVAVIEVAVDLEATAGQQHEAAVGGAQEGGPVGPSGQGFGGGGGGDG